MFFPGPRFAYPLCFSLQSRMTKHLLCLDACVLLSDKPYRFTVLLINNYYQQWVFFRFGAINFFVLSGNTGAVASIYSVPSWPAIFRRSLILHVM